MNAAMQIIEVWKPNGESLGIMEYPLTGEFNGARDKTIARLEAAGYLVEDVTCQVFTTCPLCGGEHLVTCDDPQEAEYLREYRVSVACGICSFLSAW